MTKMDIRKNSMQSVRAEAATLMKGKQFGLLNFDGLVRHIYLHAAPPTLIPIVYRIMDNTNNEVIFVEFPHWDIDDCLDAIAIQQVQLMTEPRRLSGDECDIMVKSSTQVYKRHNIMNPNNQRVIPKNVRASMTKRCQKYRNSVESNNGSVAGMETNYSTARRREYSSPPTAHPKKTTYSEKNKTTVAKKATRAKLLKRRIFDDKINRRMKSAGGKLMSEEQTNVALAFKLSSQPKGFSGCERFTTWSELFDYPGTSFYVGSTSQKIRCEAPRFLDRKQYRIEGQSKRVFTPMITYPNGKRLTVKEAEEYGFMFVPFFEDVSMYNCCKLEWTLQKMYDELPKNGQRRLWFQSGMGYDYENKFGQCMVYISLSFEIKAAMKDGKLIRGNYALTTAYDKRMQEGKYSNKRNEAGMHMDDDNTSTTDDDTSTTDIDASTTDDGTSTTSNNTNDDDDGDRKPAAI